MMKRWRGQGVLGHLSREGIDICNPCHLVAGTQDGTGRFHTYSYLDLAYLVVEPFGAMRLGSLHSRVRVGTKIRA